jgi:predicted RNase H-like HicB family nuclease
MTISTERKPLEYYFGLKYPVILEAAPEGGYFVQIEDLHGCYSQGDTVEEALEMIEESRRLWLESAYEDGIDIPLPKDLEQYSGKFFIRAPKSLHRKLDQAAKKEGVSLNQYLVSTLSMAVGRNEANQQKTGAAIGLMRDSTPSSYKAGAKGRRSKKDKP